MMGRVHGRKTRTWPPPARTPTHPQPLSRSPAFPLAQERDIDEESEVWKGIAAARNDLFLASAWARAEGGRRGWGVGGSAAP